MMISSDLEWGDHQALAGQLVIHWYTVHLSNYAYHDVIKWKHFQRYWPFVRGIHRSPVNSPHKGQWCGALMFPLICAWINVLSKQSWGWWFETPSHPLWRHCNDDSCLVVFGCGLVPVSFNASLFLSTWLVLFGNHHRWKNWEEYG